MNERDEFIWRFKRIGEAYGEDWRNIEKAEGLETAICNLIISQYEQGLREGSEACSPTVPLTAA